MWNNCADCGVEMVDASPYRKRCRPCVKAHKAELMKNNRAKKALLKPPREKPPAKEPISQLRKRNGLCVYCGDPAKQAEGRIFSQCAKCCEKNNRRSKNYSALRVKNGTCAKCSDSPKIRPDGKPGRLCIRHSTAQMVANKQRRSNNPEAKARYNEICRRSTERKSKGLSTGGLEWAIDHSPSIAVLLELGFSHKQADKMAWKQWMSIRMNSSKCARVEPQRYSILDPKEALRISQKFGKFYYPKEVKHLLSPQEFYVE